MYDLMRQGEEITDAVIDNLLIEDDDARKTFGLDPLDFQAARKHLKRIYKCALKVGDPDRGFA